MQHLQLAGLQAVHLPPAAPTAEPPACVVLLHGYGAPGTDLVPLARELHAPAGTHWVFPQAPLSLAHLGMPAGRAWWPIDMMRLQVALMTQQVDALADQRPEGLDEARRALDGFLSELLPHLGVAPERLVLGGFSQGAMLSCDWTLREGRPLAGLVQLSGTLLCQDEWRPLMAARASLPVFQSHAPDDGVLPFSLAQRLQTALSAAGVQARFVEFRGGHGIGGPVLRELSAFLQEVLGA